MLCGKALERTVSRPLGDAIQGGLIISPGAGAVARQFWRAPVVDLEPSMTVGLPPDLVTTAQLLDHHVHQPLRHNDDFDDLVALNDGANFFITKGSRTQFFFRNLRRNQ